MLIVMDNNNESEDARRGVKRKMDLSSCDVCETEEAKYRCPSCLKHTCSLACVKRHKTVSGCCGARDKTAFVPLAEFDEIALLSDYRFLEDTARLSQQSNRDAVLLASRQHPKENMWMIRRAKAAKVTLKLLPKFFSKHRENRTIFKRAEGRFHWHLKIHFPQSNAVYSQRFPDDKLLDEILNDYIHPSESDPVKRQKLKVYVHSPQENIRVFLKAERKQANSPRYHELDLKKSLQENLMHKTIVEYPEVFVVLKQHSQEFLPLIPERSGAVRCVASASVSRTACSSAEPQSEAPVHVTKRPKVVPADDELEDGELRSDEEDGSTDGVDEDKVPVSHHDEEELHDSLLEEGANANEAASANIAGGTDQILVVSGEVGGQDSFETFIDDGSSQSEGDKFAVSPHGCQQSIPGLPDEDKSGDGGAKHDEEGKIDARHDFSQTREDETPSSSCDRSDASEIKGPENTHSSASRENTNICSSESHADVQLASCLYERGSQQLLLSDDPVDRLIVDKTSEMTPDKDNGSNCCQGNGLFWRPMF